MDDAVAGALREARTPEALGRLQAHWVDEATIVVLCAPGLDHRQAHHGPILAARELLGLADGAALQAQPGEQVRVDGQTVLWRAASVPGVLMPLLDLLAAARRHQSVAAVVGHGELLWQPGLALGAELGHARALTAFARAGEVLFTDSARQQLDVIPPGIGVSAAPAAVARAVGQPVHLVLDYRE